MPDPTDHAVGHFLIGAPSREVKIARADPDAGLPSVERRTIILGWKVFGRFRLRQQILTPEIKDLTHRLPHGIRRFARHLLQ